MLIYNYEARNPSTGAKVKAQVQAENEQAAAKLIIKQGLDPLSVKLQKGDNFNYFNRIRTKEKVLFARQLSTMINAGLPLVQSLRNVQKHTSNDKFRTVINNIISDVEAGQNFSQALGKHPAIFSSVFVSLVAAGEVSGTLDKAMERLANQQEKDAEIVSKIRGAMIYPIVVVLVMIGVIGFMIVGVLPQVENLYNDLPGASLPLVTIILLSISNFVISFWWIFLLLLILLGFFGTRWVKTASGKSTLDRIKLELKPINRIYKKMYMARFARTGATLIASGVPLIQMLEVTSQAINNVHIEASIEKASQKVKGGKSLADAIEGDPNFLELVPNMLHIGEQSGAMEAMLEKVADYYEKEVDTEIKTISTIIEPALMIVLGAVALLIVLAVLLPIYGLAGKDIVR